MIEFVLFSQTLPQLDATMIEDTEIDIHHQSHELSYDIPLTNYAITVFGESCSIKNEVAITRENETTSA